MILAIESLLEGGRYMVLSASFVTRIAGLTAQGTCFSLLDSKFLMHFAEQMQLYSPRALPAAASCRRPSKKMATTKAHSEKAPTQYLAIAGQTSHVPRQTLIQTSHVTDSITATAYRIGLFPKPAPPPPLLNRCRLFALVLPAQDHQFKCSSSSGVMQ